MVTGENILDSHLHHNVTATILVLWQDAAGQACEVSTAGLSDAGEQCRRAADDLMLCKSQRVRVHLGAVLAQ